MTVKIKDYPGTGCAICWTRKNLNECIGDQYLTVQELIFALSHWRNEILETNLGGAELNKAMKSILWAGFAYFEKFSDWRMAHERAEMFNFKAEDYSIENVTAYSDRVFKESITFVELTTAMKNFESIYKQVGPTRQRVITSNTHPNEEEHFCELTAAIEFAQQQLATTTEARRQYIERLRVYTNKRLATVQELAREAFSGDLND